MNFFSFIVGLFYTGALLQEKYIIEQMPDKLCAQFRDTLCTNMRTHTYGERKRVGVTIPKTYND